MIKHCIFIHSKSYLCHRKRCKQFYFVILFIYINSILRLGSIHNKDSILSHSHSRWRHTTILVLFVATFTTGIYKKMSVYFRLLLLLLLLFCVVILHTMRLFVPVIMHQTLFILYGKISKSIAESRSGEMKNK